MRSNISRPQTDMRAADSTHPAKLAVPASHTPVTPPEARPKCLLSIRQVSTRCSLSRSTLYLYIQRGQFPKPYPVGLRSVRFLESDVEAWIAQRTCS